MDEARHETIRVIESELEYGKELWETLPKSQRPLSDAEKPIEFWITHIRRYVRQAEEGCYGVDKTSALEAIRKIAALSIRCMDNNTTPMRDK